MKKHLLFILALIFALCSCGEDKQQLYEPLPAAPVLGEPYVSEVTMKSITVNLPVSYSGYPKASEFSVELFENQDATGKLDKKYMKQISDYEYSVTFYRDISNFSVGKTYYLVASAEHETGTVKSLTCSVKVPDNPLSFSLKNVSDVYYESNLYKVYFTPEIAIYNPEDIDEIKLVFDDTDERDIEFDTEKPSVYKNRWSSTSYSSSISRSMYVKAYLNDGTTWTSQTESFYRVYSGSTGGGGTGGGGTGGDGGGTATYHVKPPALSITASNPYNYLPISYNSYLNHLRSSGLIVYKSGSSYYWKDADGSKHTCTTSGSSVSGSGNYYYESKIDTDYTLMVAKIYISFTCPKF